MAKYSSKDLSITVGGHSLGAYLLGNIELKVTPKLEDGTHYGDTWTEQQATGINDGGSLTLSGFLDDTATTGPDALLGTAQCGTTVAVVITWGGSKTSSFNAIVGPYTRTAAVPKMTRFSSDLQVTGAVTET